MAPSLEHEKRVATLEALAKLSGFTEQMPYVAKLGMPDVVLLHPRSMGLFIGDGKATESPGNAATIGRLTRYSQFLVEWQQRLRAPVLLAIAFSRPGDTNGWWSIAKRLPVAVLHPVVCLESLDQDERVLCIAARAFEGARAAVGRA